jgi:hypothetical protein
LYLNTCVDSICTIFTLLPSSLAESVPPSCSLILLRKKEKGKRK